MDFCSICFKEDRHSYDFFNHMFVILKFTYFFAPKVL